MYTAAVRRNRHIIVGTAGHVDHGKTELVMALTGVNTDRLREEQERGISIELGFAEMALPGGDRVGLVDVPGHERFVKAMVAGAAGIDLGLLVVAADDGVMPQTREHMEIMVLLGLQAGVVAITKCDLVDEETADIVEAEIEDLVRGTFLEKAEVVRTSARQRRGLDELLRALEDLISQLAARPTETFFRLPVDRAFTLSGVGLVVTGTAWSGQVHEGDTLELLPAGRRTRVRGVQVHAEKRQAAFAGERVALNLHGFKQEDVERGMQVATPGMLRPSYMLDARVFLLSSFDRPLRNRTRVRVHHGAAEVLGRVVLLDRQELEPGQSAPAQLRLEKPLACDRGDRIVLRFYSPMRTLGGAQVLDPAPAKHKRFREDVLTEMQLKDSGGPRDLLQDALRRAGVEGRRAAALREVRVVAEAALGDVLDELLRDALAVRIGDVFYDADAVARLGTDVRRLAAEYQRADPLAWGIGRAELQERLGHRGSRAHFGDLLEHLSRSSSEAASIHLRPHAVRVGSAQRELAAADRDALEKIEARLREAGAAPPTASELQKEYRVGNRFAAFVSVLEERGSVVKVTESLLYHRRVLEEIDAKLRAFLRSRDVMRMADFKEMTGLSRKYAVPLLEYFDRQGVTARDGDVRRPGPLVRDMTR
ncbi:MAG: selenocysteine-specific translation elongation factor [Candidatus Krumholzibacteriia bacterium]